MRKVVRLVATCLFLTACGRSTTAETLQIDRSDIIQERIRQVENGLIVLTAEGDFKWGNPTTLAERMQAYRVPGVSIAVVNDYQLEWTKGNGVLGGAGYARLNGGGLIVKEAYKSILLLAGAFTFAFLLGEMVHEVGHYLAHLAYGNRDNIRIQLDPFGGSRIAGVTSLPEEMLGVTAAAGPLLNLCLGFASFLFLWSQRRPVFLPLLLCGPIAAVQEGVNFSLGLLVAGGDPAWTVTLGIPELLILAAGISLLLVGTGAITLLLPLAGVDAKASFLRKLSVVLAGMGSLMLLRAAHAFLASPGSIAENVIPLIFSLLLAGIVAFWHKALATGTSREGEWLPDSTRVTWPVSLLAVCAGIVMFFFQIVA